MLARLRSEAVGYWRTTALTFCIQSELLGKIVKDGHVDTHGAAAYLQIAPDRALLLLEYLRELGVLRKSGESWLATQSGAAMLDVASPHYVGDWLVSQASVTAVEAWQRAFPSRGDAFGALGDDRQRAHARDQAARYQASLVIAAVETHDWFQSARRLIDLGCGGGQYMLRAVEANPVLTCLGIDQLCLRPVGLPSRVSVRQANILDLPPLEPADVVLLSNILHSYSDEAVGHILHSAARILARPGRLLIHRDDYEAGQDDTFPILASLHLSLTGCRGGIRSGAHVEHLCGAVGLIREISFPLERMVLDVYRHAERTA